MKFPLKIFFLSTAFVITASHVSAQSDSPDASSASSSDGMECPPDSNSGAVLDLWRSEAVKVVLHGNYGVVRNTLKKCFPDKVPACLKDLAQYVDQKTAKPPGNIKAALQQVSSIQKPKDLPEEFWVRDANGDVSDTQVRMPKNILQLAAQKGWPATPYKTRSSGGFEGGGNLFVVVVPGAKRDIALQVEIAPGGNRSDPMPTIPEDGSITGRGRLTMIYVDKNKAQQHIGQFRSAFKSDGQNDVYNWDETPENPKYCMSCHANPFRPISPVGYKALNGEDKPMTPEHKAKVDEINKILAIDHSEWPTIQSDGHDMKTSRDVDEQPIGWAPKDSPTRTQQFIEECSKNLMEEKIYGFAGYSSTVTPDPTQPLNWKKVRTAMACYSCHNGDMRGTLGLQSFSQKEIRFKLLVDRSVPEGMDLNTNERLAIYQCLHKEGEALADTWTKSGAWMTQKECRDTPRSLIPASSPGTSAH
ncbi:MAG: hypothetical protein ABIR96_03890 [Bdellovibrionota bacterium]